MGEASEPEALNALAQKTKQLLEEKMCENSTSYSYS